jgi:hypothetical protein
LPKAKVLLAASSLFRKKKTGESHRHQRRTHLDEWMQMNIHTSAGFEAPIRGRF